MSVSQKRSLFDYFGLPERDGKMPKTSAAAAGRSCLEPQDLSSETSSGHAASDSGRSSDPGAGASSSRDLSPVFSPVVVPSSLQSSEDIPVPKYPWRKFSNPDDIYKLIPKDDPYWKEDSCHHEDCWCEYCVIVTDRDDVSPPFWYEGSRT
eukprot:s1635_g17.t1